MEQKKSCSNCKFFILHYIIDRTRFKGINCGHCYNRRLSGKTNRNFPFLTGCEKWEPDEENKIERKQDIIKTIEQMCERLDHIEQILTEDTK